MYAQQLNPIEPAVFQAELDSLREENTRPKLTVVENVSINNTSLPGSLFKLFAAVNAAILGVFWMIFSGDKGALFMVTISGVYLAAYLGTPYVMTRIGHIDAPNNSSFTSFLNEPFETWTGLISGRDAALQVLLIPTAILITVTGIALIIARVQ